MEGPESRNGIWAFRFSRQIAPGVRTNWVRAPCVRPDAFRLLLSMCGDFHGRAAVSTDCLRMRFRPVCRDCGERPSSFVCFVRPFGSSCTPWGLAPTFVLYACLRHGCTP